MLPRTRWMIAAAVAALAVLVSGCDVALLYGTYDGSDDHGDSDDGYERTTDDDLLAVISPDGGRYSAGETVVIGWRGSAVPTRVAIDLYRSGTVHSRIAANVGDIRRYEWIIPPDLGTQTEVSDEYQIVVSGSYQAQRTGELLLVAYSEPFTIVPQSTGGLSDVTVGRRDVQVILTDDGQEIDGDTVDVSLNGSPIVVGHVLTETGTVFALELSAGENVLEIYAVNEGSVSPNTALLEISDVTEGLTSQQWRLAAGEYGRLTITAP